MNRCGREIKEEEEEEAGAIVLIPEEEMLVKLGYHQLPSLT